MKVSSKGDYETLYGLESHNPIVAVVDLSRAKNIVNRVQMDFGLYALFLKNNKTCRIKYGREPYDYQAGTVTSFAPGQQIEIQTIEDEIAPNVIGLLFHPNLIFGTQLAEKINKFSFFSYTEKEALHLSGKEREIFVDCIKRIREEVEHPIDLHSADLVTANIQVLLEYVNRFYDRQFITRHQVNTDIVHNFKRQLIDYYSSDNMHREGVPTVAYFAEKANLSAGYFGVLVRKETGVTAQDIILQFIIDTAKQRLASTQDDINSIAFDLGFQYPQHFTRLFKRMCGQSPTQFRKASAN